MNRSLVLIVLMGLGPLAAPGAGQTVADATRVRLGTVLTAAPGTPGGKGLLATAIAEAQAALTETARAAQPEADLAVIQAAAAGVLHVLDPVAGRSGPGHGYGLRRALAELREQTDALASDPQADVTRLAPRAQSAIRAAQTAADAVTATAKELQDAKFPEAAALAGRLREQAATVLVGAQATAERGTPARTVGGLYGLQSSLALLALGRDGTLPASLREPRGARR